MEFDDVAGVIAVAVTSRPGPAGQPSFLLVQEASGVSCFPGGKVKVNETPAIAIQRELVEEIGECLIHRVSLVFLEEARSVDVATRAVLASRVVHVFDVAMTARGRGGALDWRFVSLEELAAMKPVLLYDNWLIATGEIDNVLDGKEVVVPAGFFDSPAPGTVETRRFTRASTRSG